MVKLDVLADALAGLRPVQVQPRRCLSALSPHAHCTACAAVCPEGAIRLSPAPVIAECSGCGLCAAVCPGDGLTLDDPSDHQLLRQVSQAAQRSATVSVGCAPGASVRVECPGRVPAELLLAAVAAGAQRVELVCPEQLCRACRYGAGRGLALHAAETAGAVLTALGRPETVAVVERPAQGGAPAGGGGPGGRPGHQPIHQDRREFLLAAFGLLRQSLPAPMQGARPAPPEGQDPAARSPRRDLLLWACETLDPGGAGHGPAPWPGGRPVLQAPCTHCGVCVRLCPGQALSLGTVLSHLPRRCMHCGLCAQVCPAGALQMAPGGALADLLPDRPAPLGQAALLTCSRCGEVYPATAATPPTTSTCLPCHMRGSRGEDWLS
ncbi:MAG: hypothetical protein K0R39_4895 [Symbiobacteriaceae bacterium]|nr:hypothetical protein [Symbiobacteriaceae bacterium]